MMYNSKMAVAIKANGRVLRELKDTVFVPFGQEYSILLKNLNSVRASVSITIDGVDVTDGNELVVMPNCEFELERFIKMSNMASGNKFKFIERTASVEKARNNKIDDGLIRIAFKFEKPVQQYFSNLNHIMRSDLFGGRSYSKGPAFTDDTTSCNYTTNVSQPQMMNQVFDSSLTVSSATRSMVNDVGITVAGGLSDQKFQTVAPFQLETEEHVMILKMLGETQDGLQIASPVTVKSKPKCVTCHKVNKATAKFCTDCGTSLQIV